MNAKITPTKERILDAAELLFEQNGIDSTSTRQIADKANANSAAPNFHFVTKDNLIKEVFRRRMEPLVQQRLTLLQQVLEVSGVPEVGAIYDSFVDPLVQLRQSPNKNKQAFLRLLARNTLAPRKEFTALLETELADYVSAYTTALKKALPHLTPKVVGTRFDFAMATIARAFSDPEGKVDRAAKDFVLAGLTGAASKT
jgi:AcrR family transcriptional regulator